MTVHRPASETVRLGKEIYERDIRHLVEADHHGQVIAIDVASRDYALGENAIDASESLRAHHPNAEVWLMRVGHQTLYRFGGSSLRRSIGMSMLVGYDLHIEVADGGRVVIESAEGT